MTVTFDLLTSKWHGQLQLSRGTNLYQETAASLGLASPGAVIHGVTPM